MVLYFIFIAKISPVAQIIPFAERVISTQIFRPSIFRSFPVNFSSVPMGVGALKSTLSHCTFVFPFQKKQRSKTKELEFPLLLKNNLQSIFICSKNCLYGIYFLFLPKKDKTICGKTEIWQVLENS